MLRQVPYRIWLFLVVIHALYFLVAMWFGDIYTVDSRGYLLQADNLLQHHSWYAEDWNAPVLIDYFSFRPPLYACFLIACKALVNNDVVVLLVQNLLSLFNCLLLFHIFRKLGYTERIASKVLMLVLLFYPAQFIHANLVMTEILLQSMLLLLFYYTWLFTQQPSLKRGSIIALLLVVSLLTKPVIVLFGVLIIGICLRSAWRIRKISYVLPMLALPLVFHLVCLQNKHMTGYYHYSSVGAIVQLKYNAKYALVSHYGEAYADSAISAEMIAINAQPDFAQRNQRMQQRGTDIIEQYPVDFAKNYLKGIAAFFADPGRYDVYHLFGIDDEGFSGLLHELSAKGFSAIGEVTDKAPKGILLLLFINLCWNLLVLLAFVLLLFDKGTPPVVKLLVYAFVLYIAAATGTMGLSRYRVPVYPMLCIAMISLYNRWLLFRNKGAGA